MIDKMCQSIEGGRFLPMPGRAGASAPVYGDHSWRNAARTTEECPARLSTERKASAKNTEEVRLCAL